MRPLCHQHTTIEIRGTWASTVPSKPQILHLVRCLDSRSKTLPNLEGSFNANLVDSWNLLHSLTFSSVQTLTSCLPQMVVWRGNEGGKSRWLTNGSNPNMLPGMKQENKGLYTPRRMCDVSDIKFHTNYPHNMKRKFHDECTLRNSLEKLNLLSRILSHNFRLPYRCSTSWANKLTVNTLLVESILALSCPRRLSLTRKIVWC